MVQVLTCLPKIVNFKTISFQKESSLFWRLIKKGTYSLVLLDLFVDTASYHWQSNTQIRFIILARIVSSTDVSNRLSISKLDLINVILNVVCYIVVFHLLISVNGRSCNAGYGTCHTRSLQSSALNPFRTGLVDRKPRVLIYIERTAIRPRAE